MCFCVCFWILEVYSSSLLSFTLSPNLRVLVWMARQQVLLSSFMYCSLSWLPPLATEFIFSRVALCLFPLLCPKNRTYCIKTESVSQLESDAKCDREGPHMTDKCFLSHFKPFNPFFILHQLTFTNTYYMYLNHSSFFYLFCKALISFTLACLLQLFCTNGKTYQTRMQDDDVLLNWIMQSYIKCLWCHSSPVLWRYNRLFKMHHKLLAKC